MQTTIFDYFDAIYCINLDRRPDRWELVKKEFEKMGIEDRVKRFPAFDIKEKHVWCALSHRYIIKLAKENRYNNILVLEDDIYFNKDSAGSLEKALDNLKQVKWDIFYLGVSLCLNDIPYAFRENNLLKIVGARSTHAIAYNSNIYDKLLDCLPKDIDSGVKFVQKFLAIDAYYSRYCQKVNKTFMPLENICYQQINYSDNEKKIHNLGRHQKFYFFLFRQNYLLQKLKKKLHTIIYLALWH